MSAMLKDILVNTAGALSIILLGFILLWLGYAMGW